MQFIFSISSMQILLLSSFPWCRAYLICAGDPQTIKQWDKHFCTERGHDGIREGKQPESCPIAVGLSWCANDGDARHEAGSERHGHGHGGHLPSSQQELLAAGVLAAAEGLEESHPGSGHNNAGKHHIVPHREEGHRATACHADGSPPLLYNWEGFSNFYPTPKVY